MKHYHQQLMYIPTTKFPSWEEPNHPSFHQEPFGGFMWPPRSYTCTFCRREFRSAQALGGHMNVHRRDRARLKQSSPPQNDEDFVETKLSMGIDSVEFENVVCKKHKKSDSSLAWSFKVCPSDRCSGDSSMEDIDLELRLGDAPAIKKEYSVIF